MKFWVRFLKTIFSIAAPQRLKKIQDKSLESVLKNAVHLLDPVMVHEIKQYVINQQTLEGGFSDRGGKCDLYYSLFGYFVSEALGLDIVQEPLKKYIKNVTDKNNLDGIHLFCGAILYAKLFGHDSTSQKLKKQISAVLKTNLKTDQHQEYTSFLGVLALYYLEDYAAVWKIIRQYQSPGIEKDLPCPVLAAMTILLDISGKQAGKTTDLLAFYRNHGGFVALQRTPTEDLLSTAVALFALHFQDADVRMIKPDCLGFIDHLYTNGGFCATKYDIKADVEYTFYGLLALGSLHSG